MGYEALHEILKVVNCYYLRNNVAVYLSILRLLDGDWSASLPASASQYRIDGKCIHLLDISTPSTFRLSKGLHQELVQSLYRIE